jgi:hypothetical protein
VCVQVDDWGARYPTHVGDVAAVLSGLLQRKLGPDPSLAGIFHWSSKETFAPGEPYTKFKLCGVSADDASSTVDSTRRARAQDPRRGVYASLSHDR